jgi:hypothetical protein
MRSAVNSSVIACAAVASIGALAITPLAPPPDVHAPPPVTHEVRLAADSVPLGAIPLAFLRNQLTFCGLICPSIVQLVLTVPIGAVQSPVAFLGALQSGSLLKAIGAAAESVTAPADAATTGIITPDVFTVVPKSIETTLDVAVVQAINVAAAVLQPGELIPAVETAQEKILQALDEPATDPPSMLPTGAQGFVENAAVAGINVVDAIAFQAGELLLAGLVHTANVSATELANTGNVGEALGAGAAAAAGVIAQAGGIVTGAVNTAATNVGDSLHQTAPSTTQTTTATTTPVQSTVLTRATPKVVTAEPAKSVVQDLNKASHRGSNGTKAGGAKHGR